MPTAWRILASVRPRRRQWLRGGLAVAAGVRLADYRVDNHAIFFACRCRAPNLRKAGAGVGCIKESVVAVDQLLSPEAGRSEPVGLALCLVHRIVVVALGLLAKAVLAAPEGGFGFATVAADVRHERLSQTHGLLCAHFGA
jgi:hypothetical protein